MERRVDFGNPGIRGSNRSVNRSYIKASFNPEIFYSIFFFFSLFSSREYLKDLIEANHIFMKMLEHFCKRHRTLVVQKKAKKVRKKRSKKRERDFIRYC